MSEKLDLINHLPKNYSEEKNSQSKKTDNLDDKETDQENTIEVIKQKVEQRISDFVDNLAISNEELNQEKKNLIEEVISEMKDIASQGAEDGLLIYNEDGEFLHAQAPNGETSNLNEISWILVRTKNFNKWFGDWRNSPENSSKIVDKNGEPMKIYHGSSKKFNEFNWRPNLSKNFMNYGSYGSGNYFTTNKDTAVEFGENVFEGFIDIRNPFLSYAGNVDLQGSYSVEIKKDFLEIEGLTGTRSYFQKGSNFDTFFKNSDNAESAIKCLIEGSLVFEESRLGLLKRQSQEMPQNDTASKNYINQTIQPEIEMIEGIIKKLNSALNKTDELLDNIELVESENKKISITPHITYSLVYQGYDGIVGYQNSRQFYHPSIENTNMKSIEDSKEIVTLLPSQSKSSSNIFFSTDKNVNH
ncbi:MAG: hypothetical protein PF549_00920 [Patescibacteria group bacterium]|jgi:hypothetical protein|nr:hypothetical protein [Patescibacteria group bacterium]